MKLKTTVVCAAVLSALSTAAGAVDWNGYFRAGPGQKEGDFRCFGANMEGGTYRLGNECHTYGEFALSQGGEAGGVSYKALLMTNFFKPGSDVGAGTGGIGVNQLYLEGKGYDVAPNQTFWIGRRFYGRADVHMVDTFFVNMSGTGAGVDGVSLGGASVNFAAFRDDQPLNRLNVDVNGIAINPGGTLRVTGVYTKSNVTNGQDGFGISLQHNQSGLLFGGDNTLWLQYSSGSAYLNMGGAGATEDRKRWRLVESMTWTKGPLTAQALVLFGKQDTNNAGTSTESFNTFGGRVAYAFTKNFKLQGELGVSSHKPSGGQTDRLTKFTIAPTLTVGPNYYDRPELRFYVSTFKWNDAYRATRPGLTGSSETSAGFQVETWF
jgi:maltoporin